MNISEHRVREFAHQIWESEGRPDGQAHRHWEMACRLAEESEEKSEEATPQQQQAAPQHTTVEHNDTDMINKPKKAKSKAIQKTVAKNSAKANGNTASDFDSANQNRAEAPGKTAVEGVPEPQGKAEKVSFAKAASAKSSRSKKAKLLKDVVETELSPVNSGIQPV